MKKWGVEIEGNLEGYFRQMALNMKKLEEYFRSGLIQDIAKKVLEAIKSECPVDTGALRDSHRIEDLSPTGFKIVAGGTDKVYYARLVHDGYIHNSGRFVSSNAWMIRGFQKVQKEIEDLLSIKFSVTIQRG